MFSDVKRGKRFNYAFISAETPLPRFLLYFPWLYQTFLEYPKFFLRMPIKLRTENSPKIERNEKNALFIQHYKSISKQQAFVSANSLPKYLPLSPQLMDMLLRLQDWSQLGSRAELSKRTFCHNGSILYLCSLIPQPLATWGY